MLWPIIWIVLGFLSLAGIAFIFFRNDITFVHYKFEPRFKIFPMFLGFLGIGYYIGVNFGLYPLVNANQYAQWLKTPFALPATQTWVGADSQGLPLRITLTAGASPTEWHGTLTSSRNFLTTPSLHTNTVHLTETLSRRAGTATVTGTIIGTDDPQPLTGTIHWASNPKNSWGFTTWHTLPTAQWTWQGTLGGIPYTLHG